MSFKKKSLTENRAPSRIAPPLDETYSERDPRLNGDSHYFDSFCGDLAGDSDACLTTLPVYFLNNDLPSDDYTRTALSYNVTTTRLLSCVPAESSHTFIDTEDRVLASKLAEDTPVLCPMVTSSQGSRPADGGSTQDQSEGQQSTKWIHASQPDSDGAKGAAVAVPEPDVRLLRRVFVCPHRGCPNTFTRKRDVTRHLTTKHQLSKPYKCPAFGRCFKGQKAGDFARFDKLTAHMRRKHHQDTLYCCPYNECGVDLLSLHLCAIHLKIAHPQGRHSRTHQEETTILWMARQDTVQCPIAGCRRSDRDAQGITYHLKHFHLDAISGHPLASTTISSLNDMHILASKSGCEHGTSPGFARGTIACSCLITDLFVHCPICGFVSRPGFPNWNPLNDHFKQVHAPSDPENLADLRLHREAILRLLPSFGHDSTWGPVWEDLAHVVPPKKPAALEDSPAL